MVALFVLATFSSAGAAWAQPATAAPAATAAPDPASLVLRPLEEERPESGGRPAPTLEPEGDGFVYRARPFDAHVRSDGTIWFEDAFPLEPHLPLLEALELDLGVFDLTRPRLERPSYGDGSDSRLPAMMEGQSAPLDDEHGRVPEYLGEVAQARSRVEDDGRDLRMELPVPIPIPVFSVNFDVFELATLALGEDPHYYQRLWILDQTESLRNRLADETRAEDLRRSMRELRPRLSRIWNDRSRPPPARRHVIFEAWDECDEGTPEGDAARDEIESFVRDRLPCTGRDAYTADELDALNASRESEERFDPYAENDPESVR